MCLCTPEGLNNTGPAAFVVAENTQTQDHARAKYRTNKGTEDPRRSEAKLGRVETERMMDR